jgi:hypothetical protein
MHPARQNPHQISPFYKSNFGIKNYLRGFLEFDLGGFAMALARLARLRNWRRVSSAVSG